MILTKENKLIIIFIKYIQNVRNNQGQHCYKLPLVFIKFFSYTPRYSPDSRSLHKNSRHLSGSFLLPK